MLVQSVWISAYPYLELRSHVLLDAARHRRYRCMLHMDLGKDDYLIGTLQEIDTPGHTGAIAFSHPELVACSQASPWTTFANGTRLVKSLTDVLTFV